MAKSAMAIVTTLMAPTVGTARIVLWVTRETISGIEKEVFSFFSDHISRRPSPGDGDETRASCDFRVPNAIM